MYPTLLVYGGPNGSGKSTITTRSVGPYVNADDIQRHLNCEPLKAAEIAEETREYLLAKGRDFTFESVLSTDRNFDLMRRAKSAGYWVSCIYILTNDPEINIRRVAARVRNNGHDVPPDKVRTRYWRALKLLPRLFSICDECYVYDNSFEREEGEPHRIIRWRNASLELSPCQAWSQEMLERLVNGTYFENQLFGTNS